MGSSSKRRFERETLHKSFHSAIPPIPE